MRITNKQTKTNAWPLEIYTILFYQVCSACSSWKWHNRSNYDRIWTSVGRSMQLESSILTMIIQFDSRELIYNQRLENNSSNWYVHKIPVSLPYLKVDNFVMTARMENQTVVIPEDDNNNDTFCNHFSTCVTLQENLTLNKLVNLFTLAGHRSWLQTHSS